MAFNTGNPVPSTDGRDLSDNAEIIDGFANSTAASINDRLGVPRRTLSKINSQVLELEAQYVFTAINSGVWAAGQIFTALNQYMVFSGTAYKPKNSTSLPYVVGASPVSDANVEVVANLSTAQGDARYPRQFDTVANMILTSPLAGEKFETTDYRSTQRGGGASYLVKTAAQATTDGDVIDGFGNHTLANGNVVILIRGASIDISQFGAKGTGNDSGPYQAALNIGGEILTLDTIPLDSLLNASVSYNLKSKSGKRATIVPSFTGNVIQSDAPIATIERIGVSGSNTLMRAFGVIDTLTVSDCQMTGVDEEVQNFLVSVAAGGAIQKLVIEDCITNKVTLLFADDATMVDSFIERNTIKNPPRFAIRNITSGPNSQNYYIRDNIVTDINGAISDKAQTARCFQVLADGIITVENNKCIGAESTTATNFVYWAGGDLICKNNTIKAMKGTATSALIDDKGVGIADNFTIIDNNVFDQTGISFAQSPETAVRINEGDNVSVTNNTFRGLTCFCCRFYTSSDQGDYIVNAEFSNNRIYDHLWPVTCQIFQSVTNCTIEGNNIYKMTNPNAVVINGGADVRMFDVYQTFDNGADIDKINIRNNIAFDMPAEAYIVLLQRNVTAVTSEVLGVSVTGNEIRGGATGGALVWFAAANLGAADVINNIGPVGITETKGTVPAGSRLVNNVVT